MVGVVLAAVVSVGAREPLCLRSGCLSEQRHSSCCCVAMRRGDGRRKRMRAEAALLGGCWRWRRCHRHPPRR